jgi:CheY-like chemotaxis protein
VAATTVLLVDDVAAFRKLVGTALRLRGGFEVVAEAADGRAAVECAAAHHPDVVVLDLGLPDLAGSEVIQAVHDRSPASKIVVFTGRDVDLDGLRSVQGVVRKDDDVNLLVDVIAGLAVDAERPTATIVLPRDPASAATARAFVQEQCSSWGVSSVVDDALLVVSELVTNAVVHADSEAELSMALSAEILRIEVADSGVDTPDPHLAGDDDEHGRGLLLIAVLSAAWGTESRAEGGKVVWADLPVGAAG